MRIEPPRPALTPPLGPEDHILGSDKAVLELVTQQVIRALDENQFGDIIRRHVASGLRSGVNTTPTFYINGLRHNGGFDKPALSAALHEALAGNTHSGAGAKNPAS